MLKQKSQLLSDHPGHAYPRNVVQWQIDLFLNFIFFFNYDKQAQLPLIVKNKAVGPLRATGGLTSKEVSLTLKGEC